MMKMSLVKLFVVAFLVVGPASSVMAQDYDEPEDAYLATCVGRSPSNKKMLECLDKAWIKADERLKASYKQAKEGCRKSSGELAKSCLASLNHARRNWLHYRDDMHDYFVYQTSGLGEPGKLIVAEQDLKLVQRQIRVLKTMSAVAEVH